MTIGWRRSMGHGARVAVLLAGVAFPCTALANSSSSHVSLRVPHQLAAGGLLQLRGVASGNAGAAIVVERRRGSNWVTLVRGHTDQNGRFDLTWIAQSRPGRLTVRAAVLRAGHRVLTSSTKTVRVVRAQASSKVVVSPRTVVLDPTVVISVPLPGRPGTLLYAGGNDLERGEVVVIGRGPHTPDGFLGKVSRVTISGAQARAIAVPASLTDAVLAGKLKATMTQHGARANSGPGLAHEANAALSCNGSANAEITARMAFGTSITMSGAWSSPDRLQRISLIAGAHAVSSLSAAAQAAGYCKLELTPILSFDGPSATAFVGPIPVVMESRITIDLDAEANVGAQLTSSIGGSFDARAGIAWTRTRGFSPIDTFTQRFSVASPTLSSNASLGAHVAPVVDVLMYGRPGPQLTLRSGLNLRANVLKNPWWTLTAPIDLTGKLDVPVLNLSGPTVHLYTHAFVLGQATGAAPGRRGQSSTPPKPNGSGTPTTTTTQPSAPPGTGTPPTPPIQFTTYDAGPGTGAPPSTLGPYTMLPFPADPMAEGTKVTSVDGPMGLVSFDAPQTHYVVGGTWLSWSNGYTGDVFWNSVPSPSGDFETRPSPCRADTGAFYLYAEPNGFQDFTMSATSDDGTTSGDTAVTGNAGARYFGFYVACGHALQSITVKGDVGDIGPAIGEFGIAPASACLS